MNAISSFKLRGKYTRLTRYFFLSVTLFSIAPHVVLSARITSGEVITVPFFDGNINPDNPASNNVWEVDGFTGNLFVSGTLNIIKHEGIAGEVKAFSTIIDGTADAPNAYVFVRGEGARLINSNGMLTVGTNGRGYLTISEGGFVSSPSTSTIGLGAGSIGIAEITGSGSLWDSSNNTVVGQAGTGTLIISDGGTVKTPTLNVAMVEGNKGTLIVGSPEESSPVLPGYFQTTAIIAGAGDATLLLNHSANDYVIDASINGGSDNAALSGRGFVGNLTVDALSGRTIINSDHGDFTGLLQARGNGILAVNGDVSGGSVQINSGGTLEGSGRVGNTSSSGTIAPGSKGTIGTLVVDGNYHGNSALAVFDSVLGGDDSASDRLYITGNATGLTNVNVNNLDGNGEFTSRGIPLIHAGSVSLNSAFTLQGDYITGDGEQAVIAGAHAYAMRSVIYNGGRWWYLSSGLTNPETPVAPIPMVPTPEEPEPGVIVPEIPVLPPENGPQRLHPGAPLYEQYPQVLAALNHLPTFGQRTGGREQGDEKSATGAWSRISGTHGFNESGMSSTDARRQLNMWQVQTGVDVPVHEAQHGLLAAGLNFTYEQADANISADAGSGDINTTGYGPGLTLTWYGNNGFYVDGQARTLWFNSNIKSRTTGDALTGDNSGRGYAGSVETGWRLDAGNGYAITPQAQLEWSRIDFDSFRDQYGSHVTLEDGDSLRGRAGASIERRSSWQAADGTTSGLNLNLTLNVMHEMLNGSRVALEDLSLRSRDSRTSVGTDLGSSVEMRDGKYAVYGNAVVSANPSAPSESYSLGGNLGVRVRW